MGLESEVGLGFSAEIDIRNPAEFPDVRQLSHIRLLTLPGADVQYVTTGLNHRHGDTLDFFLVAPSEVNASTPIILATKTDSATGWHDLTFDTRDGGSSTLLVVNAFGQALPGPAVVSVLKPGTPSPANSSSDGLVGLKARAKHVLPYASEPFGVYQALLGWRSNLSHERIAAATANRFLAATRLIGGAVDLSVKAPIGTPEPRLAVDRTGTAVGAQLAAHISGLGSHARSGRSPV